jgi:hypothetical protein
MNDRDVTLKAKDEGVCTVSWTLVYRASLFGFNANRCDGPGVQAAACNFCSPDRNHRSYCFKLFGTLKFL